MESSLTTAGGHRIAFAEDFGDFDLLSHKEIGELVDLFYRFEKTAWVFQKKMNHKDALGEMAYVPFGIFRIALHQGRISRSFERGGQPGGNLPAASARAAAAMVLLHELQHCHQLRYHKFSDAFFTEHRYRNQHCEQEARRYVDENLNEVHAYLGLPPPRRSRKAAPEPGDELAAVADLLAECQEITIDDVREELRRSRILNPNNVQRLRGMLQERGIQVQPS